jgi:hypothetical protein
MLDVQPHQTNDKMETVLHDPAPIARPVQFVGWSICGSNGWAVARAPPVTESVGGWWACLI